MQQYQEDPVQIDDLDEERLDQIQRQIQQAADEMQKAAQDKEDAEIAAQQQLFGNPDPALMQMVYGSESADRLGQDQEDFQECTEQTVIQRIDASMKEASPDGGQMDEFRISPLKEEDGQLPELRAMRTRKQQKNYIQVK